MTLRPRVLLTLAVCAGSLGLVAGCGSSAAPVSAVPAAAGTAAAEVTASPAATGAPAPTGAPAASPAADTAAPDPCSLLTAAEVSAAVDVTVGQGVESVGPPPLNGKICNWSASAGRVVDFEVKVTTDGDLSSTSQTAKSLFATTTSTFPGLTASSGIGDQAYFGKTNGYVLKGNVLLDTVADIGGTADSSSINKTLTAMAVAKLP